MKVLGLEMRSAELAGCPGAFAFQLDSVSTRYCPPEVLLTLLPLATVFLPTGVGEGALCQGHGDGYRRTKTVGNKQRVTVSYNALPSCPLRPPGCHIHTDLKALKIPTLLTTTITITLPPNQHYPPLGFKGSNFL